MRKAMIVLPIALLIACSSSPKVHRIRPNIQLVQLLGPADAGTVSGGQMDVKLGMRIKNPSGDWIRLRKVDIASVGDGAYSLRSESFNFDRRIDSDSTIDLTVWVAAMARGRYGDVQAWEPVRVRAVAHFESPTGNFSKILIEELSQPFYGTNR
jgi:hypothetical protein